MFLYGTLCTSMDKLILESMQHYTRYILLKMMYSMALIVVSLTGIALLVKSLSYLEYIVDQGIAVTTFLYLMALFIPTLLWVVIPVAIFISVLITYTKLQNDSEFVILKSAGLNNFKLFKPVIVFLFIITSLSYAIGLYLLPSSFREFKDMQSFIRDNYASILLQEGVFSNPTKGLTVYIREKNNHGDIKGIIVHDKRNPAAAVTYMAEYGKLRQTPSGPRAYLENGNQQEVNLKTGKLQLLHFERYSLDLKLFNADIHNNRWREPQERYLHELFYPTDTREERLKNKLLAEGHNRIAWPLINLILGLLALIPFVAGDFNRRGKSKVTITAIILALITLGGILYCSYSISKHQEFIPVLYALITCTFIMICTFVFKDGRFFMKKSIPEEAYESPL